MSLFQFKKFSIDQGNCPMKINTDGVLLGAIANVSKAKKICDIGTGTGVIALMLAQRNLNSYIDALDIDERAVNTAEKNFKNSLFNDRVNAHHYSFVEFFEKNPDHRYDLIVTNPPFFLNALRSPHEKNNIAKHTNEVFFIDLLKIATTHLTKNGSLELIVPIEISEFLQHLAIDYHMHLTSCISVKSYDDKNVFRHILRFQKNIENTDFSEFVIYEKEGQHSIQYITALKDFFIIF
jgi:tRNA1Val (adenine37-N6)-methyltransferase